jgi:hypothetical protein
LSASFINLSVWLSMDKSIEHYKFFSVNQKSVHRHLFYCFHKKNNSNSDEDKQQ